MSSRISSARTAASPAVAWRVAAVFVAMLATTGCTWVHMAPGASKVRVVEQTPSNCDNRGEIEVSVKDSIAFYDRNQLKVRDELETLARNEAPAIGADTVQPVAPPASGEQRFIAWRCIR